MAFNPFHNFRKHQKVVFAGLTILCMITFVLGGGIAGGGDFFGWITRMFAQSRDKEAFKLYGKEVSTRDLQILQQQREIAQTYVASAISEALKVRANQLEKSLQGLKGSGEDAFRQLRMLQQSDTEFRALEDRLRDFPFSSGQRNPLDPPPDRLDEAIDFLIWKQQADRLGIHLTEDDVNEEVKRLTNSKLSPAASQSIQRDLSKRYRMMTHALLLSALTDEFRVRLARSTLEGFEPGTKAQVPAPVTPDEFWKFYRDNRTEIQVALLPIPVRGLTRPEVGASLLGLSGQPLPMQPLGAATAAAAGTAPDLFAAVKDKPPEAELQALFRKYRSVEPAPESETPGFKQPRRLQFQWISVKSDDPKYSKSAEQMLAVSQATLPFAFGSAVAQGVPVPLAGVAESTLPISMDLRLQYDYDSGKDMFRFRGARWTDPNFALSFYQQGLEKPESGASLLGLVLGSGATGATPLTAALGFPGGIVARDSKELQPLIAKEAEKRIPVGATLLLAGAGPAAPFSSAALVAGAGNKDQFLPLEAVKKRLQDSLKEETAQRLAANQLQTFLTTVLEEKLKKTDARKDKNLYKELEAAALKAGLRVGMMTEPVSQNDIARAPDVKSLKDAWLAWWLTLGAGMQTRQTDRSFAQTLFGTQGSPSTGLYAAERMPMGFSQSKNPIDDERWRKATEPMLYWKIKDESASVPLTLDKVRAQVIAAWKLQKARALAQKEADRLSRAVTAAKGNLREVRDLAAKNGLELVELGPIAKLVQTKVARSGSAPSYEPYRLPEERIVYDPRSEGGFKFSKQLVEQLLTLKDKPAGTTLVVTDQPKETYYVAVMVGHYPPPPFSFFIAYREESSRPPAPPDPFMMMTGMRQNETLLVRFEQEQRQKYRKEVIDQMRAQAGITATNPSSDFRRGYGGTSGPSDD